jgi:fatty-acyl-CoA synthase
LVTAGEPASTDNFLARPGVKVVDAQRRLLPAGETGFLVSPTPATGYFNDPEATAKVFFVEDGIQYVVPGDLGRLEVDGTITLLGRGSATINTGGEKVYPAEVEEVLRSAPGVEDCLVFGIRDERFGERVCAILQPGGTGVDSAVVTHIARSHLAGYKLPRVLVIGPVPRFPNGKPDYESARMRAARAGG